VKGMKTTVDAVGRVVVPKALRQALGLEPGQPLEIRAGDGRLEIEIAPTPMRLRKRGKGVVAVPETKLPRLTAEQVRDALERARRWRRATPASWLLPLRPGTRAPTPCGGAWVWGCG